MDRLGALAAHLRPAHERSGIAAPSIVAGAPASSSSTEAAVAEESAPTLLSDAQVREFIVRGVLTLPVGDLSPEFHRELHAESERMFDKGIALGNDIFPGIAGLKDVMESRTVRGALTSLLGEGYAMHPHRHMHNSSSQGEQTFHKGPCGAPFPSPQWRRHLS